MFRSDRFAAGWRRLIRSSALIFLSVSLCLAPSLSGCGTRPLSGSSESSASWDKQAAADPALSGSYEVYRQGEASQALFDRLTGDLFLSEATSDTLTLHYSLASPADYGIEDYEATFGQYSREAFDADILSARQYLDSLLQIPRESLSGDRQLTYDILTEALTLSVQTGDFYYYRESLGPTTGLQAQLPVLLAEYHFRSERDILDYLALCKDLPRYFGQILSFEQEKAESGLFMCDMVLDQILDQCRSFCEDPEHNFMLAAFNEALEKLDWLKQEEKLAYRQQNRSVILESVIPAYEQLYQGLSALRGQGVNEQGLCYLPQGSDYYRLLVQSATGSSRPVEELIRLVSQRLIDDTRAMSQIYRTTVDMDRQLKQNFTLTDPELILMDLQSRMREDFPVLMDTYCQIKYVPSALEAHLSPAFYLVPPMDALTENYIYVNSSATDTSRLYTTLAHEAYPGHLYQTVYSASHQTEPLRSLLNFKGFTEGWATYVERLAYGYEDSFSPELKEFVTRNASATLALYALCDMNIHLNGWDLQETAQFLRTWITGLPDESIQEIYYAILAAPANYLSYHVGAMEFELLREDAMTRLGDAFDAKEFHTFILETGACPFDVLRERMEEWMAVVAGA